MSNRARAEELAARLESGWCPIESLADMERAATELRRLAAVEADYARLMEKHNNLHTNAARDRAERDALLADAERYRWLAGRCRRTPEHWGGRWSIVIDGPCPKDGPGRETVDAAIDAAMKGTT